MKRQHLNLALGVVALGLVAAVYLSPKKDEEKKGAPLTALKADSISKIVLQHPGAPDIELEKLAQGGWMLTAPVKTPADPFSIKALTDLATLDTHGDLDPKELKKADLGLDPPRFIVKLDATALVFGGVEPIKYLRYVEVGDRVALVDDPPSSALDADYTDLVARELLPSNADIERIEVPGLSVMRAAAGPGWTSLPVKPDTGSDALQKFADAWRAARATWNTASEKATAPNPGTPAPEPVTVSLKDGTVLHFLIVSREPQLVLERPDLKVRYNLAKTEVDKLLALPAPKPAEADKPVDAANPLLPKVPGADASPAMPPPTASTAGAAKP